MELSKRLRAVAGLVTEGASVADIGTDHGYIPICLIREGTASRAIALDINEGPLMRAREHIEAFGLSGCIETRLSDGLSAVRPGEVDTMIAAGMGGGLVIHILEEGSKVVEQLTYCILQPQSEIAKVRRYLGEHRLVIVREDMVEEDGKFYPMMLAVHGEPETYTQEELLYGKKLLECRHPVLKRYLLRELNIREHIREQLSENGSERSENRAREIKQELLVIRRALKFFEERKV